MSALRAVFGVALADFRERSRSSQLLVVPVLVAYFAKVVTVDSTLVVADQYTGVPTAAWYGGMVMGIGTTVLLLAGFPLVKGSLARDRQTNVAPLVGTSPIPDWQYLIGKWISNVAVLSIATAVLALATNVAFILDGTGALNPLPLWLPFILVTVPAMGFVGAATLCFETIGFLRGTAGTVLYFLVVLTAISASLVTSVPIDLTGIALLRDSMGTAITTQYPAFEGPIRTFAYTSTGGAVNTFRWPGLAVTQQTVGSRLPIVALTGGLLSIAPVAFDRFNEPSSRVPAFLRRHSPDDMAESNDTTAQGPVSSAATSFDIDSLAPVESGEFDSVRVVMTELRMALRGHRRLWYLACIAGFVSTAVVPLQSLKTVVIPLVLLLALPVWSALGLREQTYRTEELVFVASNPLRLLSVSYVVGVVFGAILILPALVRLVMNGTPAALIGPLVAIGCLPAVALAAGILSSQPSVFEIAYLTAWYIGPMNGVEPLDYIRADPSTSPTVSVAYLALMVVALAVAVLGRRRQLRS